MATLPPSARGVDQAILEALNTQVIDLPPVVEEQNAAVDRAALYGTRQERSMFGLALVAIAASLLGLAGLTGSSRAGRISLVTRHHADGVGGRWTGRVGVVAVAARWWPRWPRNRGASARSRLPQIRSIAGKTA